MACHSSWDDFNQTDLDDFPVHIFANFEISRFPVFILLIFCLLFGGSTVDHQGSAGWQLGNQGSFWMYSVFQWHFSRNPKITTNRLFSVCCDSFQRNPGGSMRHRCLVISQPPVLIRNIFSMDFFVNGCLAGVVSQGGVSLDPNAMGVGCWSLCFWHLCNVILKFGSVALVFRGGSESKHPETNCIWVVTRPSPFLGPPPPNNFVEIAKKSRFCFV